MTLAEPLALGAATLVLLQGWARPAPQVPTYFRSEFSADETISSTSSGNNTSANNKLYVSKTKMRMDISAGAGKTAMIVDLTKQETWMLNYDEKIAMHMTSMAQMGKAAAGDNLPFDLMKPFDPEHPCAQNPNVTCDILGDEVVNGRNCQKILMTSKLNGKIQKSTAWLDLSLGYPIKMVYEGGSLELRNIQVGHQPENLFEVPSDFQKVDMSQMMHAPNQ
jgi:hypothetical protein